LVIVLGRFRFICQTCFFQAEDGIRDFHVTGVQTCALPISSRPCALCYRSGETGNRFMKSSETATHGRRAVIDLREKIINGELPRSEERRVGKECRTRMLAWEWK